MSCRLRAHAVLLTQAPLLEHSGYDVQLRCGSGRVLRAQLQIVGWTDGGHLNAGMCKYTQKGKLCVKCGFVRQHHLGSKRMRLLDQSAPDT